MPVASLVPDCGFPLAAARADVGQCPARPPLPVAAHVAHGHDRARREGDVDAVVGGVADGGAEAHGAGVEDAAVGQLDFGLSPGSVEVSVPAVNPHIGCREE